MAIKPKIRCWPSLVCTCLVLTVLLPFMFCGVAHAQEMQPITEKILDEQISGLDTDELERQLQEMKSRYSEYAPDVNLQTVLNMLKGEQEFSLRKILAGVVGFFFHELISEFNLLVRLVVLAVLIVLINKLQGAFGSGISQIAYTIAYLVLMLMAVQSFALAIGIARSAITEMLNFMVAIYPLLLTLLASLGHVISVAMFDPLLVVAAQTVGNIVSFVVLPMFYSAGVLTLVDNMSDSISISRLASLIKAAGAIVLGSVFTVFAGLTIMRGTAGAVADGVALRTGKYVSKSFLPVVGGMVADAFETVIGCSLLLKNALGVFGLILVMILCSMPALKIAAIILIYRVAAAFIEPLGDERIPQALSSIASLLTYVLAAVITVGVMFFIVITVIVIASNAAVMMR